MAIMKTFLVIVLSGVLPVALSTDTAEAPLSGSDSLPTNAIAMCEAAPNCESYQSGNNTLIRFKAGMEPGSEDYNRRFANNASVKVPTLIAADDGVNTNVQYGDGSFNYGSVNPSDGIHHLYDICHEFTCDSSPYQVSTQFITHTGASSGPVTAQIALSGSGQYNGWDDRNNFVDAAVTAAMQHVDSSQQRWCIQAHEGADCGTLTQNQQSATININRFSNGNLQGWIRAEIAGPTDSGWCNTIFSILSAAFGAAGAIEGAAGAVSSVASGFFGVVAATCS